MKETFTILVAHAICCGALILVAFGIVDLTLLVGMVRDNLALIGLGMILLAMIMAYYLLRYRGRQEKGARGR